VLTSQCTLSRDAEEAIKKLTKEKKEGEKELAGVSGTLQVSCCCCCSSNSSVMKRCMAVCFHLFMEPHALLPLLQLLLQVLEGQVKKLQEAILDVGGPRLRNAQSKLQDAQSRW